MPRTPLMRSLPSGAGPSLRRRLLTCVSMLRSNGEKSRRSTDCTMLLARDDPAGGAEQQVEQIELDGRQVERIAGAPRHPRALVDRQIADHEPFRRRGARSARSVRDRRSTASMRALSSRGLNGFGR